MATDIHIPEKEESGWHVDDLVSRLVEREADGGLIQLSGVNAATVKRKFAGVRRELESRGRLALRLDPTEGDTLRALTTSYTREVKQRRRRGTAADDLVGFLASARDRSLTPHSEGMSARAFKNAICRLWEKLSAELPATLFVFDAEDCSSTERQIIEHFVRDFFADPVAEFAPGLEESDRLDCQIVFTDSAADLPFDFEGVEIDDLDLTDQTRESVRHVLSCDDVVDRFLASTGGDPEQLEALISTLPDECENFWHHRYGDVDERDRLLIDLLAIAGEPLSLECLERAFEQFDDSTKFSVAVRRLTDEGFVSRKIEAGTVRVHLADGEFRRILRDELPDDRRQALHGALALAAVDSQLQDLGDRFLARHFMEAGEAERGFQFGRRAARRLHAAHELSEARELFETLLAHADETNDEREIRSYLLDIESALGDRDSAIEHLQMLKSLTDDDLEVRRLECKEGELRTKSGEYDIAEETFQEICESVEDRQIVGFALFGRAEAKYLQNEHHEAEEILGRAIEALESEETEEDADTIETSIRARNLEGRLALWRGDIDAAQELFETNFATARRQGIDGEMTRAELNLAVAELQRGNYAEASKALEELLNRSPGPEGTQRAALLINLGMAAQHNGKYADALQHNRAAIREAKRADYEEALGAAAYNLATILDDLGAFDEALEILEEMENRQLDDYLFVGQLPELLRAKIFIERGDAERAIALIDQVDFDDDERVSASARLDAVVSYVHAHLDLGQPEQAKELLESFEPSDELSDRDCLEGTIESARAALRLENGEYEKAASLAKASSSKLEEAGYFADSARAAMLRIRALKELNRTAEAASIVERRLVDIQERADDIPEEFRADYYRIPVYSRLVEVSRELDGDVPEAFERLETEKADESPSVDESETVEALADGGGATDEAFKRWRRRYGHIVGEHESLMKIFRRIDQVAGSDSPVLIQGESGTGKELIANAIYRHGRGQSDGDTEFVKVNCGAFVDNLLLSELFGHEQGAFTGAVDQKVGRFEIADGGTIFLDEIGEISTKAQVSLLRVLQNGQFERVGGSETKDSDVRIICATNRDLEALVESGEFRLDLYYRLKGVLLELPPLRERQQDIPRLVKHFARQRTNGQPPKQFSRGVLEFLASYSWPGNVRELKNFVNSILLFVDGDTVEMEHLRGFRDFFSEGDVALDPPEIEYDVTVEDYDVAEQGPAFDHAEDALVEEIVSQGLDLPDLKKRIEHESIRRALEETDGNITHAARLLKMSRPRLSQIVNDNDKLVALKEKLVG